jgi:6-phosphogluconate dehydrogenase
LNRIVEAYGRNAALHNLLLDKYFTRIIKKAQQNWRVAVAAAIKQGVAYQPLRVTGLLR